MKIIIKKKCQQKELIWMCKTDQTTRNYIVLCRATKCPTEAEKIEYAKKDFRGQKRNQIQQNLYSNLYYNG